MSNGGSMSNITNVILQTDGSVVLVRENDQRTSHPVRNLIDQVLPEAVGNAMFPEALAGVSRVEFCAVEPEEEWYSLPQLLGVFNMFEAKAGLSFAGATFVSG